MILPVQLKTYRDQVLKGELSDASLKAKMKHLVEWATTHGSQMDLAMVNCCIHWHLAHAPKEVDRQMLLEISQDFENFMRKYPGQLLANRETALYGPLPFSFTGSIVGFSESLWFDRIFPGSGINWEQTMLYASDYGPRAVDATMGILKKFGLLPPKIGDPREAAWFLKNHLHLNDMKTRTGRTDLGDISFVFNLIQEEVLRQRASIALFAEVQIPEYRRMRLEGGMDDPEKVFDQMRLALTARNRKIIENTSGQEMNLLAYPGTPGVGLFPKNSNGEETWVFRLPLGEMDTLLLLFVKNSWPVGYAFSLPGVRPEGPCIGMHVFSEHRGTPSSSFFFDSLVTAAKTVQRARKCFIQRHFDERIAASRSPENETALTSFYEGHGFRWEAQARSFMERDLSLG
ncbi:MAG: hypothetical protein NT099_00860 [Candidatus Saganbacteria bacterium]|nr:hypothetical protein [Candidatus Saganbacteria bacterium]